ncbi:hypothetical protein [Legionella gresilensis]|uniref:hypothetical protein n=1 Tax=Legionella gresilensis TaxID=91823 RepID=UPI0010417F71|nr:hypothetical protein [Legionella gresilensis]
MDRNFFLLKAMMEHFYFGGFMAIAFARVSIHTRAKGHSALAASSYRSGTRLHDSLKDYDYSNRHDVAFS